MNSYDSLNSNQRFSFQVVLHEHLVNAIKNEPDLSVTKFYEDVCSDFNQKNNEQIKRTDKPKKLSSEPSKVNRKKHSEHKDKVEEMDPFQKYCKSQIKLRKEEFAHTSYKNRQRAFAHEWNLMSEAEKQNVVNSNGHFF